ncbi:ceramide synthase 2-like [Mercenaria mercenaria]|uniref:ceramide synthase 2-like n=1 Tax=Mercenaria mercenaria TaxID=6596 RepID=UPI00234F5E0D|nr:ceramide synthase 2-like [Mercenaria mercenaria]
MLEWIWDEDLWFPENSTGPRYGWKDLENKPGSDIYHPQVHDLHWSFILGVALVGIRFLIKKVLVEPIGYNLGVPRRNPSLLVNNTVLENAFNFNKEIGPDLIKKLSKQTDMTIRRVEIWFRMRRKMELPSPMKKFEDCSWHFIFYSTAFIYGLCVLWDHVSTDIFWYYIIEMAFYWCLILSLVKDHRRKDFTELVIHHVATIILLYFSWFMNFVRIGTLVLIAHDAADPWLALAKMNKYTKHKQITEVCFIVFILVWIISRLMYYPFVVLYSSTVEPYNRLLEKTFFAHWFFNFFLYLLMVLHLMWSYSIARIVVRKLRQGQLEDVRSDSDSDEDAESDNDCDVNGNGVNGSTVQRRNNGLLKLKNSSIQSQ